MRLEMSKLHTHRVVDWANIGNLFDKRKQIMNRLPIDSVGL